VHVDANPHIASEANSVAFESALEFKNLSFYYDAKTPILKDVSFTLPKGKTVALVGASGSGKSTLADLAVRFYDVVDGGIFLDGVNIKTLNLNAYRSLFAMVTQESILFNDTLASNIYFGSSIHDAERFNIALETSYLKEVVEGLEGKELFNVGERGNKLSGGQKQRLSIARAIYKNAPILILDEATSALDNVSEARIQEELEQVMGHQTCLMIAHRLSTVQKADHIIVLEKGEIIEQGTHQELIQLEGTYKKMFELQSLNAS
jgi:subfamily B ATP-binding cassette protein MsbA